MFSDNAIRLLKTRYAHNEETAESLFKRIAKSLSIRDAKFEKELYVAMTNGDFLPNSPAIRNAGFKKQSLSACFVLPIEDSIAGIYQTLTNMAMVFQRGGGVGINFSTLRPKEAKLSSGGSSSGAVSFMDLFDATTEVVKSGGFRRGASLFAMGNHHPDIEEFCQAKLRGKLTNANLSVVVTDDFMNKATKGRPIELYHENQKYGSVRADNILDLMSFGTWVSGDPGILFYDRINRDNRLLSKGIVINTTNPCGEVPLPAWGACCLGSVNLSHCIKDHSFDKEKFISLLHLATRTLLNINVINYYPLASIQKTMQELNPIGVGIMGFADALIKLGVCYDSEECLKFIDEIGKIYVEITNELAPDSFYRRSVAPTGSLSILADCSSGIEPVFSESYVRTLVAGEYKESRDLYRSEYCRVAHEIEPYWHLKVQAKWQEYVDAGVSKTINCASNTTVEDIRKLYIQAWKAGCKGITVFRDRSINGVYRKVESRNKCEGDTCQL